MCLFVTIEIKKQRQRQKPELHSTFDWSVMMCHGGWCEVQTSWDFPTATPNSQIAVWSSSFEVIRSFIFYTRLSLTLDFGEWPIPVYTLHPGQVGSLLQGNIERPKTIHAHSHSSFRVPSFSHVHSFGLWEEDGEPGASQPGANKWVVGESVNGFWAVWRSRRTWRKPTETQEEHANLRQQC